MNPQIPHVDVVVIGTGPAGLQAAIHAARRKVSVLVLGRQSGSSIYHHHVENYCCLFPTTGEDILANGRRQAAHFGAVFRDEEVLSIAADDGRFRLRLEGGGEVVAKAIVLATGTARRSLGVEGEKRLLGRGVSYCVECDCNFFRGAEVAVVGGGSAAVHGALAMLDYARKVHLVFETLETAPALAEELRRSAVVQHPGRRVTAILGEEAVEAIQLDDGARLSVQGVFIELGARGVLELAAPLGVLLDDEMKHIQTNRRMETNVPGIYAAGDITGPPWQVAKAVGEGCVAGLEAAAYARRLAAPEGA